MEEVPSERASSTASEGADALLRTSAIDAWLQPMNREMTDSAAAALASIFHDGPDRGLSAPVVSMLV